MSFWRLIPAADPDDPRWLDHPIWTEVVVQADGAADARLAAGALEIDPNAPPTGNEWPSHRSAFDDEKLYWAEEVSHPDAEMLGAPAGTRVIRARRRDGKPTLQ